LAENYFQDEPTLLSNAALLRRLCDEFTTEWESGKDPKLEELLARVQPSDQPQLLRQLLRIEVRFRSFRGEHPSTSEFHSRFPSWRQVVDDVVQGASEASTTDPAHGDTTKIFQLDDEYAPGQKIGRYLIRKKLGQGGFGRVYLALDEELDRLVAVKVPIDAMLNSAEATQNFLREAKTAAQLRHPGLVAVYDAGRSDDGRPFVVMQYIEGQSLHQRLRSPKQLSHDEVAQLFSSIAEAVAYAHKQGLVHRDLKPGNVLMDVEGRPHVADFGLAIGERELRQRAGERAGTLQYMSPEQVEGDMDRLDGRADVWALGVMLYEALTGRLPFGGDTPTEIMEEVCHRQPRPPRMIDESIPQALEQIVHRCLQKSVAERYSTAHDLARDLRFWKRPSRSARFMVGAAIAVALMLLIGAGLLWKSWFRPSVIPNGDQKTRLSQGINQSEFDELVVAVRNLRRDMGESINPVNGLPTSGDEATSLPAGDASIAIPMPAGFSQLEADLAAARQAEDKEREVDLLLSGTNDLIDQGHYAIAERLAQRMVELSGDSNRPIAHGQLGLAQYRLGKWNDAIANYQIAADIYRDFYDRMLKLPDSDKIVEFRSALARLLGITLMRIGNVHKAANQYALARDNYSQSQVVLENHDRSEELATLLLCYGSLESQYGHYERATNLYNQGLSIVRKTGATQEEAEFLVNMGNAAGRIGDNQAALVYYQQAFDLLTPESDYNLRSLLLINWIPSLLDDQQHAAAREKLLQLKLIARAGDEATQKVLELLPVLNEKLQAAE